MRPNDCLRTSGEIAAGLGDAALGVVPCAVARILDFSIDLVVGSESEIVVKDYFLPWFATAAAPAAAASGSR